MNIIHTLATTACL